MNQVKGTSDVLARLGHVKRFKMPYRKQLLSRLTLWLAILSWLMPALANDWQANLDDGRRISVDLNSNRVLVIAGKGQGVPLWDGVHRLQDGSVITVRSGLMVPNRAVLEAREAPPGKVQPATVSACSELVDKACGAIGACDDTQACDLARQLQAMARSRAAPDPAAGDWAVARCRQGLADETVFTPCDAPLADNPDICQRLVRHLCGTNDRCTTSEGCEIARKMLDLEQAALRERAADYVSDMHVQCQSVFREHAYFPPCR